MAKYIEVGQDVVEFPDDMTDAQIEQVLASQFKQPTQNTSVKEPKKSSIWEEAGRQLGLTARAGITGIAGIPTMLAEPVAAGINALTGREVFPNQAQALQNTLTNLGFPEPQNRLERAVQTGASAMAGTGGQAQLAQKFGGSLFAPMTKEVPQQLAAAAAAGTTAQAVSEKAEEAGYGPVANVAATLAVGGLAGALGAKAVRMDTKPSIPEVTPEQVKAAATQAYKRVDDAGITVKPLPVLNTLDDIEANLVYNSNFNPLLADHAPIKTVLDQMRKMVGTQRMTFTQLDQMRQAMLAQTQSKEAATRRLAGQVISELDKKISTLQPQDLVTGKANLSNALDDIKEARSAWRRMSKTTILEDVLNLAEAKALAPNASEGELIRTQFKALAANKNKMKMFDQDEQEAIKRLVSGGSGEQLLALAARLNPQRNTIMMGSQAYLASQDWKKALAMAGVGYGSDKALAYVQKKAAQDLMSQILSGKINPPKDNVAWRALLESKMAEYSKQENQ